MPLRGRMSTPTAAPRLRAKMLRPYLGICVQLLLMLTLNPMQGRNSNGADQDIMFEALRLCRGPSECRDPSMFR